jgi:hypothetical protein
LLGILTATVNVAHLSPSRASQCLQNLVDQLSGEVESSADSAASFNRSALLMYFSLGGANLALAFLA